LVALLIVFQQALLKRHPHHGCSRSLVNWAVRRLQLNWAIRRLKREQEAGR
jgi:hypothetical protein